MKIKELTVSSYKKFVDQKKISFVNLDGQINESTLIIGNNGTGKTSILQAIVILLATATRQDFTPDKLDWVGNEYRFIQSGKLPIKIETTICFNENEINKTIEYARNLIEKGVDLDIPNNQREIKLYLDFEKNLIRVSHPEEKKIESFYQFGGYQYAKRLSAFTSNQIELFEHVGNIYWYNEQRNSYNFSLVNDEDEHQLEFIRNFLSNTYNYHMAVTQGKREIKEGEFDFYDKLESVYKLFFPERSFVGPTPRFDIFEKSNAPDFFLSDGKNQYELSGMSAGERAIFPIIMDFTRWNINNSIVIIDELELHLHPPLQQAFVRVLPKLGKNNQFIYTSHSASVAALFNKEENQVIQLSNHE